MNATGKKARREFGLNRFGCHRAQHSKKSPEKIKRAGWTREKMKKAA